MDPDPAIFVIDLQEANQIFYLFFFSAYYFLKVHLHHFRKKKKSQRSPERVGIKGFLTIFA
jgi:hypothetical protein